MALCERPAWTGCVILLWLLLLPSTFLTHIAVDKLIGPLRDLPANIEAGFETEFKFAALEGSSSKVMTYSVEAMQKCNWNGDATDVSVYTCINPLAFLPLIFRNQSVNTNTQKNAIIVEFITTLNTVLEVTNDKYFGVPGMQNTARQLGHILLELSNVDNKTDCSTVVTSYCAIWLSANAVKKGISDVNSAIDSIKGGDLIKKYNDGATNLDDLHGLPYSGVIALLLFTCFHAMGGVCCRCRGGGKCACLVVLLFILFWLVSFVFWTIVLGAGYLVKTRQDDVKVTFLRGSPTVKEAIEHVQNTFPVFWDMVFEDMENALATLWIVACLFTIFNIWIVFFFSCECCCRPFAKDEGDRGKQ